MASDHTDLIARLRDEDTFRETGPIYLTERLAGVMNNAADLIEEMAAEIERLKGVEHTPTQWAYDQACAAIEKHRVRAEAAEAEVARLREALKKIVAADGHASEYAAEVLERGE